MPEFASVAAYVVIDTFVLLIWHQTVFSRICRETPLGPLQHLVNYYLLQCDPLPLYSLQPLAAIRRRGIFKPDQPTDSAQPE
jgi:hypothetical protein